MDELFRDHDHEQLDSDRLLECAQAAYAAAQEVADYTGQPMMYPADLMGHELQPDSLAPFTRWEIEQASEFLVRMGWIQRPRRAA
jgi:hypothetical protein